MAQLQFYNTLSRQLETFTPGDQRRVSLYVCGPTVYDDPHLGHARCYITWDVLYRLLKAVYPNHAVIYARNITDVDDKILNRAQEQGISPEALTEHYTSRFNLAMQMLNVLPADENPQATQHIAKMIEAIASLLQKGYAYEALSKNGDVYFDIAAYNADFADSYPVLKGQTLAQLQAGARVEVNPDKKHPLDFALWKTVVPGESTALSWPVPWTQNLGRPGWHIECSAMNAAVFGDAPIDIHAGGADLMFPHHDCEIAQSQAWHGESGTPFARFWLHNGFVNVSGEKMSKSLNNFKTIYDVLEKFSANAVRYFLLQHHYRSPVDFTHEALQAAENRVTKINRLLKGIEPLSIPEQDDIAVLLNDLDTPKALALANQLLGQPETLSRACALFRVMGFNLPLPVITGQLSGSVEVFGSARAEVTSDPLTLAWEIHGETLTLAQWIEKRAEAKQNKNWALSDQIRDALKALNVQLNDNKDGTTSYELL
ncbi:MAG: cysteine--tRNA ligase [Vampirovibrionales bacterium]|nr:cysteine--tRNA ligase [Vampirovibrionales bacterium]